MPGAEPPLTRGWEPDSHAGRVEGAPSVARLGSFATTLLRGSLLGTR